MSSLEIRPALTSACSSFRKALSWLLAAVVLPRPMESPAALSLATRLFFCPAFRVLSAWTAPPIAVSACCGVWTVTVVVAWPAPASSSVTVSVTVYVPGAA